MLKILQFLLFILVIALIAYFSGETGVIKASAGEKIKVVDGDSLEIGSRRIRLNGIDSPEYTQDCYTQNHKKYSCGIKAKHYMEKLIAEGNVECREVDVDRYQRSLSVCYIGDRDLNAEMVSAGWAVAYRDDGKYEEAEQVAKQHKRGIWQGKFMRPELYRFLERRSKR